MSTCRQPNGVWPSAPGTLTEVTPDGEVPTIPNATSGQGLLRLAT